MKNKLIPLDFVLGFVAPLRGWQYLSETSRLNRLLLWPALLGGVATLVFFAGSVYGAFVLSNRVSFEPSWVGTGLKILFVIALVLGTLGTTAILTLLTQSLLYPWWHGLELEKIERELGVSPGELRSVNLVAEATDSVQTLAILGGLNLVVFVLQWIPAVGVVLGTFLGWYWNSFYLGLECLDYPLALRGRRRREKVEFAKQHRSFTMGLGSFLLLLGWVPVVGTAIYACGAVGSALAYRRLAP